MDEINERKHNQNNILIPPACAMFFIIFFLILSTKTSLTYASSITSPNIISPQWTIGKPWEPIHIRLNITSSDKQLYNVTIYYSFNTTEYWLKDYMHLSHGDNITGSWDYIIQGQPNGSIIFFFSKIYFEDGSYQQTHSKDNPRVWKISFPKSTFRIHYFSIENINEKKLTADVKISFDIIDGIDADYREVKLDNHMGDSFLSESFKLRVPYSAQRYHFYKQIDVVELRLSGDTTRFPYDGYYLWLEFDTYGNYTTINEIENVNLSGNEAYTWDTDWSTETLDDGSIKVLITFKRRNQSIIWFEIPLQVFLLILACSMILDPLELGKRISIFTGLIFYLFTFSNNIRNYVPERAIGASFAEIFVPYLALIATGYLIASMINYSYNTKLTKNASNETIFASSVFIDLIFVAWPLVYFLLVPVLKTEQVALTLYDIMPRNLYTHMYVIPAGGLIVRLVFYYLNNKKHARNENGQKTLWPPYWNNE